MKTNVLFLKLFLLILFSVISFSCIDQIEEPISNKGQWEEGASETPIEVTFHLSDIRSVSKSSFSTDEDAISNLSLLVYRGGKLVSSTYTEDTDGGVIVLTLTKGVKYNLYTLANCGEVNFPLETELLNYRYIIPSLSSLNDGYPMCWNLNDFVIKETQSDINIQLERLVSKVTFSLDKGVLDGLKVTSVRLKQSSKAVCPFGIEHYALSSQEVMDGDYASLDDLTRLNNGQSIEMYVPENCQGTLLEGNTDSWNKIPDNISKGDRCTYIEVGCTFNEGFALQGDVTYRMYLGRDPFSNFDIIRNSRYIVSLTLTSDGLNKISWKVDSEVDYTGLGIDLILDNGLHNPNDLYIGEDNTYKLIIPSNLKSLLTLDKCSLVASLQNNDIVPSPNIEISNLTTDGSGNIYVNIKGTGLTTAYLKLLDQNKKYIGDVPTGEGNIIRIKKANIRYTNPDADFDIDDTQVANYTIESRKTYAPIVNDTKKDLISFWLVDDDGYAFNTDQCTIDPDYYNDLSININVNSRLQEDYHKDAIISSFSDCQLIRNVTDGIFDTYCPLFKYNGHSVNAGTEQTSDLCDALGMICSTDLSSVSPQIKYTITGANINEIEFNDYLRIFPLKGFRIGPTVPNSGPFVDFPLYKDEELFAVYNPSNITFNYIETEIIGNEPDTRDIDAVNKTDNPAFYEWKSAMYFAQPTNTNQKMSCIVERNKKQSGYRMYLKTLKLSPYDKRGIKYNDYYVYNWITPEGSDNFGIKGRVILDGYLNKMKELSNSFIDAAHVRKFAEGKYCIQSLSGKVVVSPADELGRYDITKSWADYIGEHSSSGDGHHIFFDELWYVGSEFTPKWSDNYFDEVYCIEEGGYSNSRDPLYDFRPSEISRLNSSLEYISIKANFSYTDGLTITFTEHGNISNKMNLSANIYFGFDLKYTKDNKNYTHKNGIYRASPQCNSEYKNKYPRSTDLYADEKTWGHWYVCDETDATIPSIINRTITVSPGSSTTFQLLSADEIADTFMYINHGYWMASTTNSNYYDDGTGVSRRNDRFSTFAFPADIKVELILNGASHATKVIMEDDTISDIDLLALCSSGQKFYTKTSKGYYASDVKLTTNWAYASANPDGSHRRDIDGSMPATNYVLVPLTSNASSSNITTYTGSIPIDIKVGLSHRNSWICTVN